jgi:hypothetical protein
MGKKSYKYLSATKQHEGKHLAPHVADTDIAGEGGNDKCVLVCIKNLQSNYECFSDWSKADMGKFWDFNDQLHQKTWQQVYESASTGANKRGLAYTVISRDNYERVSAFVRSLSPEIHLFELRVDERMRVHGYRQKSVFYLCLLDKDHRITG